MLIYFYFFIIYIFYFLLLLFILSKRTQSLLFYLFYIFIFYYILTYFCFVHLLIFLCSLAYSRPTPTHGTIPTSTTPPIIAHDLPLYGVNEVLFRNEEINIKHRHPFAPHTYLLIHHLLFFVSGEPFNDVIRLSFFVAVAELNTKLVNSNLN